MTTYGWDTSNYDDPIRVRDGIDLFTHKAGEGHHFYYDREYGASLNNARALGIPVLGAYFVNHPGSVDDQVDWFIAILDQDTPWWRDHPCFILQIDAEQFGYMDRAPTEAEIQAFGDRLVQVHGVAPARILAYAPQWLYGNDLAGLTYRLWASNYGANPYAHYLQAYPGDQDGKRWQAYSGQTPLLLQYGSNTTIGDQTTCDANAFRGSVAELIAALGGAEGDDMTPEQDRLLKNTETYEWKKSIGEDPIMGILGNDGKPIAAGIPNIPHRQRLAILVKLDAILAKLNAGGGGVPGGPVDLTVAAVAEIAVTVRAELDKTKLAS